LEPTAVPAEVLSVPVIVAPVPATIVLPPAIVKAVAVGGFVVEVGVGVGGLVVAVGTGIGVTGDVGVPWTALA
jgi:hypothetical protein